MRKLSSVTDFFVICGSDSIIGVKAIADAVLLQLKKEGVLPDHVEGLNDGQWVLADYGTVVVHVFLEKVRKYYDLESLWGDAPRRSFRPRKHKAPTRSRNDR